MLALVSGFEPFGGEAINPSAEALHRLPPKLGPLAIETRLLPTAFERSVVAMDQAIAALRPDIILAVGQAGGRNSLSIERAALNIADAAGPDNDGAQPIDRPVVPGGPAAYFATLPIKAAVAALRHAGLPAEVSNSAGSFVCNALFYAVMHRVATRSLRCRAGFLHVPYLPRQAAAMRGVGSMALEHMVQGIQIILAVTAERSDDIRASEGAEA
jgi:pyroglutamyl-peptidase